MLVELIQILKQDKESLDKIIVRLNWLPLICKDIVCALVVLMKGGGNDQSNNEHHPDC